MILTFIIAVIPTIILGYFVYKKDILEKEPIGLITTLFCLGTAIILPAIILENVITLILPITSNEILNCFTLSFFCVALVEEGLKASMAYEIAWRNKNFNHIYDGIVYCVFTSLGFATLENILYVFTYGNMTGILRAIVSVPGHAFFGVTMGYYMGFAKYNEHIADNSKKTRNILLSILLPIVFHGLFDFLLLTNNQLMIIIFFIFVLVLYIISYLKIRKLSKVMNMLPQ